MEFKIKRTEFLKALSWTQSVVERKTTMPILSHVLLKASENKLELTATDLEIGVRISLDSVILTPGKLCVPAKNLYEIIRELASDEVEFSLSEDQSRLLIQAGRSKFKVVVLSSDDFPNLPQADHTESFLYPAAMIKSMIEKTLFAISSDESRYHLHGICLERSGQRTIRAVATDGHRLSYSDREVERAIPLEKGIILPKKAVLELKKIVSENEDGFDVIALAVDGKNLIIKKGGVTFFSRLIDGDFPDYRQVVPTPQQQAMFVDRKELLGALKRVSILATDRISGVRFRVNPQSIEISVSNSELGEAQEEVMATYDGEPLSLGFNSRYFMDVLNILADDQVRMEFNGEVGPCVLRSEIDPGFLSVIMPMRV